MDEAGVDCTISMPSAFALSTMAGDLTASLIEALSLSTIGCGVPAGAKIRYQVTTSSGKPVISLTVGTSGKAVIRSLAQTARMRRRPASMKPLLLPSVSIWKAWRPASVSCMAGAEPR